MRDSLKRSNMAKKSAKGKKKKSPRSSKEGGPAPSKKEGPAPSKKKASSSKKKGASPFDKVMKSISDAKRLGVNVENAEAALKEARDLEESGKGAKAKAQLKQITSMIKLAKKKKRLEVMILNTLPTIDDAKQLGGDLEAAEEWLEKAKEKLEEGIFGTAQEYINNARREADDAKRFVSARELIAGFATEIERVKRKGVDISPTMELVMTAWEELRAKKYGQVRNLMREAKKELDLAEESKEYVDMVRSTEERLNVVKETGVVTKEMWGFLEEANNFLKVQEYADVRRSIKKIQDRLDKVVLLKQAGLTIRTIQQFTNEARKSGIESEELNRLLSRASTAFEEGRFEDMDEIKMSADKVVKNLKLFDKLTREDVRVMDDEMKELFANWTAQEIQDSIQDMERAMARGDDVSKIADLITEAQSSLGKEEYEVAFEAVKMAKGEMGTEDTQVRRIRLEEVFSEYQGQLQDALEIGVDVKEVRGILDTAKMMMDQESFEEANVRLDQFGKAIKETATSFLEDKYPRIQVSVDGQGYEKQKWNRFFVSVINTGDTAARDLELNFPGDVEVKGETSIPKLIQNEEKELELALMPYIDGDVPLEISATYRRYFDETKYQLNDIKRLEVDKAGTFIVEDVFLIHRSGILVARETRRIEAEVDSDVFSGMLTAVIQFAKDSFGLPAETNLNRMEFGENKLLVERGEHVFLAITVLGEESEFLPFYMTEILREVEERFANELSNWTGELDRFSGVEEIIRKIIFVKENKELNAPVMPASTLAHAMHALAGDTEATELKENLINNVRGLTTDLNNKPYGEVVNQILVVEAQLREAMKDMDLPGLKERTRDSVLKESVKGEIEAFRDLLELMKNQGLEIQEEEKAVGEVIGLYERGEYEGSRSVLNRAKGSIKGKQNEFLKGKLTARISGLETQMSFAEEIGIDVGEFEQPLTDVKQRLEKGELNLDSPLLRIERDFQEKSAASMDGKTPNLQFQLKSQAGLQKDEWNPLELTLSNTGDMPARNIDIKFPEKFKVKYLDIIEALKPQERRDIELAVRTEDVGDLPLEITASYQRYFDPTKYQISKMSSIMVEDTGSFVIDDVFLIHKTGILIANQTRKIKEVVDSDVFSGMLTVINQFVKDSFHIPKESALHSLEFGDSKVLLERGDHVFLALSISGRESPFLPLYMVEAITNIETAYLEQFEKWNGDLTGFEGLEEYLKELITIKFEDKTEVPLFQSSLIAPAVRAVVDGKFSQSDFLEMQGKLTEMNANVSREGFEAISSYLQEVQGLIPIVEALPESTDKRELTIDDEELKRRMHNLLLKADISIESAHIIDDKLNVYLETISDFRELLAQFRAGEGLPDDAPLPLLTIQVSKDELWKEIAGTIKSIVREQLKVADVEILGPNDVWHGLDINIQVNESLIKERYRHIAPNIISVLKYMPPAKMVESLSRPEFTIGIEGQTVYIEKGMVSVNYSVPDGVKKVEIPDGHYYVTLEMTEEAESKMVVNSIVERIQKMREALELGVDASIDVKIVAPDRIADELDQIKDEISKETGAFGVDLPFDDPFGGETDYYVSEMEYKDELIKIGIIEVEFTGNE
jgi:hypothetical protein